eukprot:3081136-Pyramimonas_sp.AAC.1
MAPRPRAAPIELARKLEELRDTGPESFEERERRHRGCEKKALEWAGGSVADPLLDFVQQLPGDDAAKA